jgi:plastocyanin
MRQIFFLAALLLSLQASAQTTPASDQVVIQSFAFGPQAVIVKAGTKVTWVNKDIEPHTVVSNDHKFQSEALDTNDTFSVTFDTAGTYGYFCSIHPHMTGTVVVTQ